jgi:hypothetical protein
MASPSTTRGKVVLVPFPFDDLSATKLRPAVCLTEPIGTNRHVVVAFITSSNVSDLLPTGIDLPANHPDFRTTGLRVHSVCDCTGSSRFELQSFNGNLADYRQRLNVKHLINSVCFSPLANKPGAKIFNAGSGTVCSPSPAATKPDALGNKWNNK